jgi:hypothetical protein
MYHDHWDAVAVNTGNWSTGVYVFKTALRNEQLLVALVFVWMDYGKQLESFGTVGLWNKI